MARTKRAKKRNAPKSATAQIIYPRRTVEHAAKLAQDFTEVYHHIEKPKHLCGRLPKAIRQEMKKGVKNVVARGISEGVCPKFSTKEDKKTFHSLILDMMCDIFSSTVPQDMFDALAQSFKCLVPKIQALEFASQHRSYPAHSTVSTGADQDPDGLELISALLSAQTTRVLIDDSADDESSDADMEVTGQAAQPEIKLQGSLDLNADENEDENKGESDQESDHGSEKKIKEENIDGAEIRPPPDPAVFVISLNIPLTTDDHSFVIIFRDERVIEGLHHMPAREIWQLVRDAIHHDPDIPHRTSMLPWITDVQLQNDGCLAFMTTTQEDLDTVTTNVQWARNLRDTIQAGIRTYKVVLECVKIWTRETEAYTDRASVIDKLREENSAKIPSLNQIGAIRDVQMLQDPASKTERNGYANYILVFSSREAANAALTTGLIYRKKVRACVIYEPGTQWHQQCSNCQLHDHTAKDCQSAPVCGKCGCRHNTEYCTSATIKCANYPEAHVASSKKCLEWEMAEEKAHRSYRFPGEESDSQIPRQIEPTCTSRPRPPLSSPEGRKAQETLNQKPKTSLPSPTLSQPASNIPPAPTISDDKPQPPATPSALLHTIDEFITFVAPRAHTRTSRKRKASDCFMTGALQNHEHDGKRVEREEEEGPVWPIGERDYWPPSLRV